MKLYENSSCYSLATRFYLFIGTNYKKYCYQSENLSVLFKHNFPRDPCTEFCTSWVQMKAEDLRNPTMSLYVPIAASKLELRATQRNRTNLFNRGCTCKTDRVKEVNSTLKTLLLKIKFWNLSNCKFQCLTIIYTHLDWFKSHFKPTLDGTKVGKCTFAHFPD